jgi:multiple sugar transport system ATP-binding protein
MTAYDNMAFALKLQKLPKREIDARVREAAEILGIEGLLDRRPRQMSGGQRQRVAVGRAIVRKPQVFLFDEPLSNLDAKLRLQMRRELSRLHQQLRATMVYVTHDQVEAMTLGDRIVVLNAGHVQQIDTPVALYERPRNRFVAEFIGSPAMNIIEGEVMGEDGLRFWAAGGAFTLRLLPEWERALAAREGESVLLGVRPEDICVARGGGDGHPDARVLMQITLVELLGNEVLLHASAGEHDVTARLTPQPLPGIGGEIALELDRGRLHFFDPESNESLRGGAP